MNTFVAVAFFCTPEQELHSKAAGSGLLGSRQPKTPPKKGPPKPKQLLIPAHGRIFLFAFYFFCLCSCMVTLWCFLGTFNRMPGGGKRLGSVARALAKQPMLQASRVWHAYFLLFFFLLP